MTNETIELRTTVEGMRHFLNVTGDLFSSGAAISAASGFIIEGLDLRGVPAGAAIASSRMYPAGEPCDT